mmetsp:Transcript_3875/g.6783  ORF Transcript_3875/g.6783 Transcript_3875/m.6783 type:complete len:87 (+) Transcript_3875:128-388(+)
MAVSIYRHAYYYAMGLSRNTYMDGPNTIHGPLLRIKDLRKAMDDQEPAVSGLSKDTVLTHTNFCMSMHGVVHQTIRKDMQRHGATP